MFLVFDGKTLRFACLIDEGGRGMPGKSDQGPKVSGLDPGWWPVRGALQGLVAILVIFVATTVLHPFSLLSGVIASIVIALFDRRRGRHILVPLVASTLVAAAYLGNGVRVAMHISTHHGPARADAISFGHASSTPVLMISIVLGVVCVVSVPLVYGLAHQYAARTATPICSNPQQKGPDVAS